MGFLFGNLERRNLFPEPPVPPLVTASAPQDVVRGNPEAALRVPAVWSCVNLLANTVSTLPLELYRRAPNDGVPTKLTQPKILTSPFPSMTLSTWLHQIMVSLLLRGNAIGRTTDRDANQYPTQIQMLNPDSVTFEVRNGEPTWWLQANGNRIRIPTEDIFHIPGMTMPGSQIGLSPIAYAAAVIGLDINSRTFAQDFFNGGGIPKAVLEGDQQLNQEQARTLKDRLLASFRAREPIVLGSGVKYTPIQVKPEESQFLATQQADVGQIARYFNIPAEMVGGSTSGSNITYANLGERNIHFLQFSLNFWLKRIEDAFFSLFPQPQYVKFRIEELLRVDPHTRVQVEAIQIASKVKTPTEVRASYELPPMTKAQKDEVDMVPLGVTPNGGAKALPGLNPAPLPAAPPAAVPPNDEGAGQ